MKVSKTTLAAILFAAYPALTPTSALAADAGNGIRLGVEAIRFQATGQDVVLGQDDPWNGGGKDVINSTTDTGFRLTAGFENMRASFLRFRTGAGFGSSTGRDEDALFPADWSFGSYDGLQASQDIKLDMLDVDYAIPVHKGERAEAAVFFGARYVNYQSSLAATYQSGGSTATLHRAADNQLFGFRGGMTSTVRVADKVSISGTMGLSLLAGNSSFSQSDTYSGGRDSYDRTAMVPAFDLGVKVAWMPTDRLTVKLGYEYLQFQNVITNQVRVDDVSPGLAMDQGVNAGFHGLTLGAEMQF